MRNKIPTHCALPMAETGKLHNSIIKAKAILTLIQNDGIGDDELDGFLTNENIIRIALSAAQDYLEQAEKSAKVDFYFVKGDEHVSNKN